MVWLGHNLSVSIAVSRVSNRGIAFDQVTDIRANVCLQQYLVSTDVPMNQGRELE